MPILGAAGKMLEASEIEARHMLHLGAELSFIQLVRPVAP